MARSQLLRLELRPDTIDSWLQRGRLHLVHRGVYAVGYDMLTREARWMSAVLAGGPGAALRLHAAAANWGFRGEGAGPIDVSVPRARRPGKGVRFRRTLVPPDEIARPNGIPTTIVPRTLLDLASELRPRQLERALNEAERLRLTHTLSLEDLLDRYPRRPGTPAVRALIGAREATITRSELELLFLEFVDDAGLPPPRTNQWIEGMEVDIVWPQHRLAVELDGYETHSTRSAFERDRQRSRLLQAAGWRCVQVTYRQLRDTPVEVERDLRRLLLAATLAA